jgi:copper chaperone
MYLFTVPNMTCGGCAKSVTKALQSVDADAKIETDPPAREVRVQTSASEAALRAVLSEAGYPVEDEPAAA